MNDSNLKSMSPAEAFAAIPLAAVCCDQVFASEEARVIRELLLCRTPYRTMEPQAFGLLISGLLKQFRAGSWQSLIEAAVPLLNLDQQECAFALACQLIHCDREVNPVELSFLRELAMVIGLEPNRGSKIMDVCELLNRDCLAENS